MPQLVTKRNRTTQQLRDRCSSACEEALLITRERTAAGLERPAGVPGTKRTSQSLERNSDDLEHLGLSSGHDREMY